MKQFATFKVLRKHIESIPIPVVEGKFLNNIVSIVDEILCPENEKLEYNFISEIDLLFYKIFGLTEKEIKIIETAIS